jgi:Uma2 family endonuclease
MDFIPGPPTVAVEVRSKKDYGRTAEREMAEKRADYFEAGTLVVWDVDPQAETVSVYRSTSTEQPSVYHSGESAEAEPAMPGWTLPLSEIFQ